MSKSISLEAEKIWLNKQNDNQSNTNNKLTELMRKYESDYIS